MAKHLFILNDAPYGTERSYNALRLAISMAKVEGEQVRVGRLEFQGNDRTLDKVLRREFRLHEGMFMNMG